MVEPRPAGGRPWTGAEIVNFAKTQLGDPYVFGAEGPNAFDCSGLVQYVFANFGMTTPRTTAAMIGSKSNLLTIGRGDLQPGDLVFSNWIGRPSSHVGIYAGNNQIIEAPDEGQNVKITNMGTGYWSHADNYRRVPGLNGVGGASGTGTGGAGGGGGGGGGMPGDPIGQLLTLGGKALSFFPSPGNLTEAVTNVGSAATSLAESAMNVGEVAGLVTNLFLPSNAIRVFAFVFGSVCILIGIWFLASEVRDSG